MNTLNVTYTGCDICALGSEAEVDACNCNKLCLGPPENSPCSKECTSGAYYNWCIHECCESKCGNSFAERTPVLFSYRLLASWENIPFHPFSNPNNFKTFFSAILFPANGNLVIPPWTVPAPWPGIYVGHNTCYRIQATIFYSDNTGCTFIITDCNIVG